MNIVFAGYKESYLCFKSTCVVVNFCWSELSTVSGLICCTLDNTVYRQYMILPECGLLHFGHCPYLGADTTVVQTL